MALAIEFISATVMHARLRPKRNRFRYRVPYLSIPARELRGATRRGLLSINGTNLFSVRAADYGESGGDAPAWIAGILARFKMSAADGEIVLVTIPRVLGLAFNPVSFWLCFDRGGGLRAVVAEVNNTFGERHFYLCHHDDERPITAQDQVTRAKAFYVSPFIEVAGEYRFAFSWGRETMGVGIDLADAQGVILTTSVAGRREPLSSVRLARSFVANPLLMFKVLGLIHYQAARLFLKGVAVVRKTASPPELVSR